MSGFAFKSLPDGVVLGPLSRSVFDTLARSTSFPWAVMQAQCKREGVDPARITREELPRLIPHLAAAVARFTTVQRGKDVELALAALAQGLTIERHANLAESDLPSSRRIQRPGWVR